MEGLLARIYEGSGEGVAVFNALGLTITLGSGGFASKSSTFRIPLAKPRGCRVNAGILSISVSAPSTVRVPFRWRLEMEGLTISREAKPQFTVGLEDSLFHKIVFDVKPILAAKGESVAVDSYSLRALYDSAHPIVVREVALFKVYSKPRLEHSAVYMTGALVLDPGESHRVTLGIPKPVNGNRLLVVTMITPSPRVTMNVKVDGDEAEVSGPGFKLVELQPSREQVDLVVEYPKPEISIYPKKALLTNVVLVENRIPIPPLRVDVEDIKVSEGTLRVKLSISNEGNEEAEDITVTLRHAMLNIKEAKIGLLNPGETTTVVLEADVAKLPASTRRLTARVTWSKDGISDFKTLSLDLK